MLMKVIKPACCIHPTVGYKATVEIIPLFVGETVSIERKDDKLKIYRSNKYIGKTGQFESFEIYNAANGLELQKDLRLKRCALCEERKTRDKFNAGVSYCRECQKMIKSVSEYKRKRVNDPYRWIDRRTI